MDTTNYLLQSEANKLKLQESIRQFKAGQIAEYETVEALTEDQIKNIRKHSSATNTPEELVTDKLF